MKRKRPGRASIPTGGGVPGAVGLAGVLLVTLGGAPAGVPAEPAAPGDPGVPGVPGAPGVPGVAHADGVPPAHTGGFGEPTCRTCHAEYPLNVDGRLDVEGFPERYEPGRSYTVTVVLESGGMERAGFQAALRWDEGGDSPGEEAGSVGPSDGSTEVRPPFVQHAPGGRWTDGEERTSWSFAWTAPTREGPVVLHVAANGANGDNSPFGDIVYTLEARTGSTPP